MSQSTALRKRVHGLHGGKKLGAKRLEDITNVHNNKTNKSDGYGTVKKVGHKDGKGGRGKVASSKNEDDAWDAWDSWTDTATKTFQGVTKLVTEDGRPNLASPQNAVNQVGAGAIYHNGNVISTSTSRKAKSVSKDISALKSQGFKAFSSITKAANSFALAIEETIDEGIKEVSKTFDLKPNRLSPRTRGPTPSTSSPTCGARTAGRVGLLSPKESSPPLASGESAAARRSPESEASRPTALTALEKLNRHTTESTEKNYLGQLWTKEVGDILNGFNGMTLSLGTAGSAIKNSPENKEILQRLHTKAMEKQSQLESSKKEVIAQKLEAKKLQNRNTKLEKHIHKFKSECENLKKENSVLKSRVDDVTSQEDAAALQLGKQLQILLEEKAKLQRENQRLLSENNGLQELLSYAIPSGDPEGGEQDEGAMDLQQQEFCPEESWAGQH
ncbi:hypothetical protein HOP50_13g68130 [Chloropicon primus]|uniref:Uncharacterized protein n=2 Tax=Chloropicon primus TaxID=1764295 RepID=A0A5B8MV93_9CHLO|nr:hypothetical protein A3770_13p67950 [Chloropicon primus]UPR03484.1 hypothetical protein HOP50_13g68130 [Chloropicon primus]|eukprot:QDZ24277.1 hypothetical protein A3770_13p67950 [Chloropicon primus]